VSPRVAHGWPAVNSRRFGSSGCLHRPTVDAPSLPSTRSCVPRPPSRTAGSSLLAIRRLTPFFDSFSRPVDVIVELPVRRGEENVVENVVSPASSRTVSSCGLRMVSERIRPHLTRFSGSTS
jgi:hypothetical protein